MNPGTTMNTATAGTDTRFNPVFWLMWLLPASAVVAGFATLAIALRGADRALPVEYHWEGERLDADFGRARSAAALGMEITLGIEAGQCRAFVRNLPREPAALNLLMTHGGDAGLDRRVRLTRVAANDYRASCAPLDAGKWRVALDDDSARWAVRGAIEGEFAGLVLRARNPDGPGR
jgi:hypothetical protein